MGLAQVPSHDRPVHLQLFPGSASSLEFMCAATSDQIIWLSDAMIIFAWQQTRTTVISPLPRRHGGRGWFKHMRHALRGAQSGAPSRRTDNREGVCVHETRLTRHTTRIATTAHVWPRWVQAQATRPARRTIRSAMTAHATYMSTFVSHCSVWDAGSAEGASPTRVAWVWWENGRRLQTRGSPLTGVSRGVSNYHLFDHSDI
jgi:hypothetical protein